MRVLDREFDADDERLAIEIVGQMSPGAVTDFNEMLDDVRHGRRPKIRDKLTTIEERS